MNILSIPVYELPSFGGFYNTLFQFDADAVKNDMELYNLNGTPATKTDGTLVGQYQYGWDIVQNDDYEKEVAEAFVETLTKYFTKETFRDGQKLIGVEGVFNFTDVAVDSPEYYNYRNDMIQATLNIEASGLKQLIDLATSEATYTITVARDVTETKTIKQAFIDYVNTNYSDRSGFTSYVSNDAMEHISVLKEYLKDPRSYAFNSEENKNILTNASRVEDAIVVLLAFIIEGYTAERYRDDFGDSLNIAFYYDIDTLEIAYNNYTIEVYNVEDADNLYMLAQPTDI
jgi:hypothetical protein